MKRLVDAVLLEHVAPVSTRSAPEQRAQVVEQLVGGGFGDAGVALRSPTGHWG
jgi:hypothetical protein